MIFIYLFIFNKSEVTRTPTDDFGDRHTNQLILHSFINKAITPLLWPPQLLGTASNLEGLVYNII
jgi:hypothetical protein